MCEVKDKLEQSKVEIAVENFGPIVEANIDLRPLNVFVGPSNTGKTYFATLLYALHGVFGSLSDSTVLIPYGPKISHLLREFFTNQEMSETEQQDIQSKLAMMERDFKLSDLPQRMHEDFLAYSKNIGLPKDELQNHLKNSFDLNILSDLNRSTGEKPNKTGILIKVSEENRVSWKVKIDISKTEMNLNLVSRNKNDLVILSEGAAVTFEPFVKKDAPNNITHIHRPAQNHQYYLPAARSGIIQSHRIIAGSLVKRSTRVGTEGLSDIPTISGVVADFLEKIILYEDKKSPNRQMSHLADTLESDILSGQILFKPSASGYPDFRYLPDGTNEEIRLSQASSMVLELAPLILYLRGFVQPGDMLIIEEPEAHLHPGAQADMAVILARLVRAGVKIIITTHSDWLLQEIGNLTLEGIIEDKTDKPESWLLPDEVGVWYFQKDEPVKELPFHPRKGFSPDDYQNVAESLYNRSVNLQHKFESKEGNSGREST